MYQHLTTSIDAVFRSSCSVVRGSQDFKFAGRRSSYFFKHLLLASLELWLLLGPALARVADLPSVITERVRGQFRDPSGYRVRMTGRVKVIDANTLEFPEGTRVQAAGVTDAPDLDQQALFKNELY